MSVTTASAAIPLRDVAAWTGGELRLPAPRGAAAGGEPGVTGASIDTRTLERGELFVPLQGEHVDGHDFLDQAFARGAAAALCAAPRAEALRGREPGPLVVVADVTQALQRLAARHRQGWRGWLAGVTGSAGKTTTKDLVTLALGADRPTLATQGNLNNHWGVPLTLMRLSDAHRAAVIEMGTNHPGEIELLAGLSRPDAAILTGAGSAHLEGFGSVAAIAHEKAALARAVAPGDPVFAATGSPELLAELAGAPQRVVTYGLAPEADVRPRALTDRGPEGLTLEVDGFPRLALALVGRHQAANALAALAVARELGLDPARVVRALESYRPGKGRMEVRQVRGATLILDCYNSNPESARAALEALRSWPGASRRIALLGDMLELGSEAPRLHAETGAAVRDAELWSFGQHANDYAAGAAASGALVRTFEGRDAAARALRDVLEPGVVVLLKASRLVQLERVLDDLERE